MKYVCLAYGDEEKMKTLSQEEMDALIKDCSVYDEELRKSGHLIFNEALKSGGMIVRLRKGRISVTDGPFAETKEQVGGFFMIEAQDMDEAVRVASLHPGARMGENLGWGVEVRQIEDFSQS